MPTSLKQLPKALTKLITEIFSDKCDFIKSISSYIEAFTQERFNESIKFTPKSVNNNTSG